MVVRLKNTIITSIEDTETKKLKLIKMVDKEDGASIELELPKALSDIFELKETVSIQIDSEPISKGEDARLYAEGTVFKTKHEDDMEVVGTLGGLRLVLVLDDPKPSQIKTFESQKIYISIT